jgi:dipeptidase E
MSRNLTLLSSSTTPENKEWLKYPEQHIVETLKDKGVDKVTFVPYAIRAFSHEKYVNMTRERFEQMGFVLDSVTEGEPERKIEDAEAIVIGGGNTPTLNDLLHKNGLINPIRKQVLEKGAPYIGWSAGSVVTAPTMRTTNDMYVNDSDVFDFRSLNVQPMHLNAHYRDVVEITDEIRKALEAAYLIEPRLKAEVENKGETRDERIQEFMKAFEKPVLGMREGAILHVKGNTAKVLGTAGIKHFDPNNKEKQENFEPGADMSALFQA